MAEVVKFYAADWAKDPDAVIDACRGEFSTVLVMGWNKDGQFHIRASDELTDGAQLLWLLELAKTKLMAGEFMDVKA